MGAVVGLLLGSGLFCIWWACSPGVEGPRSDGSRRAAWPGRMSAVLRDDLVAAGMPSVSLGAAASACGTLGVGVALGGWAVSQSPPIAVSFGILAAGALPSAVRSRARRRRTVLRDLWPDVVDSLASGVRAGLSLPEALAQVGERGPEVLRPAFAAFGREYRTEGRFGDALDGLQERLADPVADRICEALRITREVGGSDLGRLLRSLSAFLRDDARTRAELLARQSWTVNAARLAVAAPWAVLAILATRPDAVRPYNSLRGVAVLAVGAGLCALAYRLMLRVARLPEERRVLR